MSASQRTCYGCAGTGKRGIFDCGLCGGTGKLTGTPLKAHTDSTPTAGLRLPGPDGGAAVKRIPVVRTRRRRRTAPAQGDDSQQ